MMPPAAEPFLHIIENKEELFEAVETVVKILHDMYDKAIEDDSIEKVVKIIIYKCIEAIKEMRKIFQAVKSEMDVFISELNMGMASMNVNKLKDLALQCKSDFNECQKKFEKICKFLSDENNDFGLIKREKKNLIESVKKLRSFCETLCDNFSDLEIDVDKKLRNQIEGNYGIGTLHQVRTTAESISTLAQHFKEFYKSKIKDSIIELTLPALEYLRRCQLQAEHSEDNLSRNENENALEEYDGLSEKR